MFHTFEYALKGVELAVANWLFDECWTLSACDNGSRRDGYRFGDA